MPPFRSDSRAVSLSSVVKRVRRYGSVLGVAIMPRPLGQQHFMSGPCSRLQCAPVLSLQKSTRTSTPPSNSSTSKSAVHVSLSSHARQIDLLSAEFVVYAICCILQPSKQVPELRHGDADRRSAGDRPAEKRAASVDATTLGSVDVRWPGAPLLHNDEPAKYSCYRGAVGRGQTHRRKLCVSCA